MSQTFNNKKQRTVSPGVLSSLSKSQKNYTAGQLQNMSNLNAAQRNPMSNTMGPRGHKQQQQ